MDVGADIIRPQATNHRPYRFYHRYLPCKGLDISGYTDYAVFLYGDGHAFFDIAEKLLA